MYKRIREFPNEFDYMVKNVGGLKTEKRFSK